MGLLPYSPGSPVISRSGRTSTAPRHAPGIRPAMSIASSLFTASIHRLDQKIAGELLLRFHEWAVGDRPFPVTRSNDRCGGDRLER